MQFQVSARLLYPLLHANTVCLCSPLCCLQPSCVALAAQQKCFHVFLSRNRVCYCIHTVARGAQSTRLVQNGLRLTTDRSPLMRTVGLPGLAGA